MDRLTVGELGLVLMGRAMLSKSLIQFSVDGQGFVPFNNMYFIKILRALSILK